MSVSRWSLVRIRDTRALRPYGRFSGAVTVLLSATEGRIASRR